MGQLGKLAAQMRGVNTPELRDSVVGASLGSIFSPLGGSFAAMGSQFGKPVAAMGSRLAGMVPTVNALANSSSPTPAKQPAQPRNIGKPSQPAAPPNVMGYTQAPLGANMRDAFGSFYHRDQAGNIFRIDPRGQRIPVQGLSPRATTEVARRQMSASGFQPKADTSHLAAQRRLGLSALPSGATYFDARGTPYQRVNGTMQAMNPHRGWQQRPGTLAANARRQARMSSPEYLASLSRAYGATGQAMPDTIRQAIDSDPAVQQEVAAHALVQHVLESNGNPEGANMNDLLERARETIRITSGVPKTAALAGLVSGPRLRVSQLRNRLRPRPAMSVEEYQQRHSAKNPVLMGSAKYRPAPAELPAPRSRLGAGLSKVRYGL